MLSGVTSRTLDAEFGIRTRIRPRGQTHASPPLSLQMNRHDLATVSALLLGALTAACSDSEPVRKGRPNVILICLDTVRADHLGAYGYARQTTPALDSLAARSIVFTQASATAGWTKPSVPSYLTSTYPLQHGVYEGSAHDEAGATTDLLPEAALTLAEVFQKNGYRTGAFLHNAQLRAGNGFEQGFDTFEEDNHDAREIRWRGTDWIDSAPFGAGKRPFFLYLHFLDAHWPYPAPEEWLTRFATAAATERFRGKDSKELYAAINDGDHALTDEDRTALEALYDGALAYLDSELGRFFEGLSLRGLDEDTIVCVIADHGEEFGEHGKVGHGNGLWENLLHVPWILRVPGKPAQRIDSLVSLIDLFPTLTAAAGLPPHKGLEGIDRLADPDEVRPILAEHKTPDHYLQALRVGSEKLLRRFDPPADAELVDYVLPVAVGTRWEAEFGLDESGQRLVTQLKPRDEDPADPLDLKGRLSDLGSTEFRIAGIPVRYDESSHRMTDLGTAGPELANDLIVKVRGRWVEGAVQAERIKFYTPTESDQSELRGTVDQLEQEGGRGRILLSGLEFRLTPETDLEGTAVEPKKRRLQRESVTQLLETGAEAFAEAERFTVERKLYDLTLDPSELASLSAAPGSPLDARLEELGAELVKHRVFGAKDKKVLSEAALKALQDIGYAGGDR